MSGLCRDEQLEFAADLANLEWAIVLVIHAPTSGVITPEDLARVPADAWAGARLVANPSLRILKLDYPANAYMQAFRNGEEPKAPSARATRVAVYRTGATIWRMELEPAMATLFEALAAGVALGDALERVAPLIGGNEAEAAASVMTWFQGGVSSGLFSDVSA